MLKQIYTRKGILYAQIKQEGKRVRISIRLKDSDKARAFISENFELFIKDKARALQKFQALNSSQSVKIPTHKAQIHNEFENLLKNLLKEKQMLKANTITSYKNSFKDILAFVNLKQISRLKDFTRQDSLEFIAFLQGKNNQISTIKHKAHIFRHAFKYALELDLIGKNPFFMPKISKSEDELEKSECKPFDLDQISTLIKSSSGELKSYLTIAFFTGLRTGELLGLKRDDLNLQSKKAHIKRTLLRGKNTNAPKTKSSYRTIDLLPIVAKELENIAQNKDEFIFKSTREKLRHEFYALQERLKITPLRRLYDTRHSFASVMLSKGEEPLWISKIMLGHSNLNQTFKTYAKYLPKSVNERAVFLKDVEF